MTRAEWSYLTDWLTRRHETTVRFEWNQFDAIVGGLPASAINHYPQWWHGDRPNTRAWRAAGYELESVELGEWVTFRRRHAPLVSIPSESLSQHQSVARLPDQDPSEAMIIVQCSGDKADGGVTTPASTEPIWTTELQTARQHVAPQAQMNITKVMPAWKRYIGTFYMNCQPALARAVSANANIVIVSGGYGLVTATEPIGWCDKEFKLSDWPPGCLENCLLRRVSQTRARSVIAFASATRDYAKLIRKTPWGQADVPVYLVTRQLARDGAIRKTPKAFALAFSAFWNRAPDAAPDDINVERLA